jgi:hypothetical protein
MGHILKFLAVGALAAATFGLGAAAEAGSCKGRYCKKERYDDEGGYRYITAEASTGTGVVTAPVRPGRWGEEVQLPGGSWVDCEKTCEYTLRRWTVDFWEWQTNKTLSPGYFRFEFDLDTGDVYRKRYH